MLLWMSSFDWQLVSSTFQSLLLLPLWLSFFDLVVLLPPVQPVHLARSLPCGNYRVQWSVRRRRRRVHRPHRRLCRRGCWLWLSSSRCCYWVLPPTIHSFSSFLPFYGGLTYFLFFWTLVLAFPAFVLSFRSRTCQTSASESPGPSQLSSSAGITQNSSEGSVRQISRLLLMLLML
jgi:hypothetical protein